MDGPRLVSLVPSWTETLIECGANVVGRSRFCIHPADAVQKVPTVGGTKDIRWERVSSLSPDLLVLDREENTREIAEASPIPVAVSHIRGIDDCAPDLRRLSAAIEDPAARGDSAADALATIGSRWERVAAAPGRTLDRWDALPGILDWIRRPGTPPSGEWSIVYLIWQDPWMTVRQETFIGSVLAKLGLERMQEKGLSGLESVSLYPELDLESRDPDRTLLLCSSEPFPFSRKRERIEQLGFPAAIVDGEGFSWFGVRSLRFLEAALHLSSPRADGPTS